MKIKKQMIIATVIALILQFIVPLTGTAEQGLMPSSADKATVGEQKSNSAEETTKDSSNEAVEESISPKKEIVTEEKQLLNKENTRANLKGMEETSSQATFNNQSLVGDNSEAYKWENFIGAERFSNNLSLEAHFNPRPIEGKKITIALSKEFEYSSLPGFKKSGGKLVFDRTSLSSQFASVITNATIEYPQIYGKNMTTSGIVTYELANTVSTVNMTINLGVNNRFVINESGRDYMTPIEVSYSEAGNENFYQESFEKITLSPGATIIPRFFAKFSQKYKQVSRDETGIFSTGTFYFMTTGGQGIENVGAYLDSYSYEVKYDKRLDLKAAVFQHADSVLIQELPEKEDSDYKYARISAKQILAAGEVYYKVAFADGVNPSEMEAGTKLHVATTGKQTYKANNREEVVNGSLISQVEVGAEITKEFENKLVASDSTRQFPINEGSDYAYLGRFNIENKQLQAVTNQKFKASFDTDNLKVQAMRIATIGKNTKNIKLTTTTGRVVNVPDNSSALSIDQIVDLANYEQASGEFLATVEWTDDVPANYAGVSSEYFGVGGLQIYGNLKSSVKVGDTINNELSYGDADTFATAAEKTNLSIKVIGNASFAGLVRSSETNLFGGERASIFNSINVKGDGSDGMVSAFKGINIYAREDGGITITPDDFLAVDSTGKAFSVKDGNVTVIETIDNTGAKVYQFSIPDYEVNPAMTAKKRTEDIKIGIYASKTSPTKTHSLANLVYMEPMDKNVAIRSTSKLMGVDKNKYGLGERALTDNIFTALPSASLIIQANIDFNVTTAANLDGGPFINYDGTPNTIIDLNPVSQSQYGLKILNSSGKTVGGYQTIIPIPKRNETTDPSYQLQSEKFGWTVNLTEPLDLSSNKYNYTVLYATKYELQFNSSNWKKWDEIDDKTEIRAVYIQTKDKINSVEKATVDNPGEDLIAFNIDMDKKTADEDAGNVNIYKALVRRSLDGIVTNVPSEAVAIRLQTGVIKGQIFQDKNRDGMLDTDEAGLNGVKVTAYESGTKNIVASATTKSINGKAGSYNFAGLEKEKRIDIVITNPINDDSERFVATDQVTISADQKEAKISEVEPSSKSAININVGMMTPTKISYDAQEGTGLGTVEVFKYPGDEISTEQILSKAGYTFSGWYTAKTDGEKVEFPYIVGKLDTVLYAHYIGIPETITFDVMGGDAASKPADITLPTGDKVELNKINDPTWPGYAFTGWYNGTTKMPDTFTMPIGGLNLKAHWKALDQTITFDVNEGEEASKPSNIVAPTDSQLNLSTVADPVRAGYEFLGWYQGENKISGIITVPAGGLSLKAKWKALDQTITFDVNEGELASQPASITLPTDSEIDFSKIPDPIYSGYQFVGWKSKKDGKFVTGKINMPAGGLDLQAVWSASEQIISFDTKGGTSVSPIVAPTDSKVDLDKAITSRKGYEFLGWFDEKDNQKSGTIAIPVGGLKLAAKWKALDQTITFDVNGGDDASKPADIIAPTDSSVDLSTTAEPTRLGYKFLGWYIGDEPISNKINMPAGGAKLVAHWKALKQTITFDVNGGDLSTQPVDLVAVTDSAVNLDTIAKPTRVGYTFEGWYNENGKVSNSFNMPVGGMKLIAKWSRDSWRIKATNIQFKLSEVKEAKSANMLENLIRQKANPTVVSEKSGQIIDDNTSILMDNSAVKAKAGKYQVLLSYEKELLAENEDSSKLLVARTGLSTVKVKLNGVVQVTVVDDEKPVKGSNKAPANTKPEHSKNKLTNSKTKATHSKQKGADSQQKITIKSLPETGDQSNASTILIGIFLLLVFVTLRYKKYLSTKHNK